MHKEVFEFDGGELNPEQGYYPNGMHEVSVCFDLPSECPSSMLFSNSSRARPLIAITY
jgi:hypothetical protein